MTTGGLASFNPTAAGTATGHLTIASNSSTSGTPGISLSGTGTIGTGPAELSTYPAVAESRAGLGTGAYTVTLSFSSTGGGPSVNLSTSNWAVTVPRTVTVRANTTSA